jgi:manganese-dependent inorganic pyrophosphatase
VATPRLVEGLTEQDQLVLVDTNNPEELVNGYDQAELLEIVDHHKLVGGLHTTGPIKVTMRPVACTATLLLDLMDEPAPQIAGLMLAAILSDTLNFSSPTTTEFDKTAAAHLAVLATVEPNELADAMFAAKSDLTGMSVKDILTVDSKVFSLGGKKVRISLLETTLPANALALRSQLELTLRELKQSEDLDGAFFFVVDIVKSEATLIVPSPFEQEVGERAFAAQFVDGIALLPGVVSRKKQIVPGIEAALIG